MEKQLLKKAIFDACLKSASAMGERINDLSWFGKNCEKTIQSEQDKNLAA
jgi:hypothetical protein